MTTMLQLPSIRQVQFYTRRLMVFTFFLIVSILLFKLVLHKQQPVLQAQVLLQYLQVLQT
jgi:hypothetical protein